MHCLSKHGEEMGSQERGAPKCLGFKKTQNRVREEKLRQKKAAARRKKKKLGNMKKTTNRLFMFPIFTIELGKSEIVDQ